MLKKKSIWLITAIALLLFAASKLGLLYWWQNQQQTTEQHAVSSCQVLQGCTLADGIHIQFSQTLGAKTPFDVTIKGQQSHTIQQAFISFSMPDMDMGFNRFDFKRQANQWISKDVRLPFCIEGRHDFLAKVSIDGREYHIPFSAK